MTLLEKRRIIDGNNLSREFYFTSLVREAYMNGIVLDSDVESIQLRCMEFLAHKSEEYTGGESSSIRVETAENIMRSNLYTVGLYLKSLPDADLAAKELKAANIFEMYQKGRKLINAKFHAAKHIYLLAQKNKLLTLTIPITQPLVKAVLEFSLTHMIRTMKLTSAQHPSTTSYAIRLPTWQELNSLDNMSETYTWKMNSVATLQPRIFTVCFMDMMKGTRIY